MQTVMIVDYGFIQQIKKIAPNSHILLSGFSSSQTIIESLNSKYPVYLEAGDHKINLNIVEINKGMFELDTGFTST